MANIANTNVLSESPREPGASSVGSPPAAVTRVFIPLVTPFLYGMERGVIELFDSLRPGVEPYFLQSNRIYQRRPPIIEEMERRGFSIELLPDKTDWERLAKPRSLRHFCQMVIATARTNVAVLRGAWGKDVLYVPGISAGSGSLLAALLYRLRGRRVIHHFRDLGTDHRLFPVWLVLVTDCVHNTRYGYEDVARKLPGIRRKRNFVLPHILDVDNRPPEDANEHRVFEGKKNLLFLGQISYHKGIDILLESFKLVANRHEDVVLHLVGECGENFRSNLGRRISSAGLEDRVMFWGFREDAIRLMRFAYVYVHPAPPSRFHESFCRSVVEAMALAVPTVCFRSGALQEIVRHEKTGLVCEESANALASAINRFLEEPNFRNACSSGARQSYEELYSPLVVRPRWMEFLEARPKASSVGVSWPLK
ncbi:MAG: glycosyltransferase family 4 protein [Acidobacteriia bacterium]|nr:glycosyltransferase family 4 protein [Terriglobia bacterium]